MSRACLIATLLAAGLSGACQGRAGDTPAAADAATDPAATPATPKSPPLIDGTPSDRPVPFLPPEGKPTAEQAGGLVVLNKGMKADVGPGATLAFESIVSDSRCPKDAQCIWAGEVTIAMKLVTPLGSKSFELSDRNNRQAALSYAIELVSYGACPGGPAVTPLPGECARLKVSADPAP